MFGMDQPTVPLMTSAETAEARHTRTIRPASAKRSVLLRLDNFHKECRRAGLDTQVKVAHALHVDRTTLWRTVTTLEAQSDFIVGALTVLWRARFDDLFEIPKT